MRLQEKILQKLAKSKHKLTVIEMHDLLMSEYGWIPLEEFKKLPMQTVWNLIEAIKKRYESQPKTPKMPNIPKIQRRR